MPNLHRNINSPDRQARSLSFSYGCMYGRKGQELPWLMRDRSQLLSAVVPSDPPKVPFCPLATGPNPSPCVVILKIRTKPGYTYFIGSAGDIYRSANDAKEREMKVNYQLRRQLPVTEIAISLAVIALLVAIIAPMF